MISPRLNALPALLVWLLALIFGPAMDFWKKHVFTRK